MRKTTQIHQLEMTGRKPTPEEVTEFIENFRAMVDPRAKSKLKLISMKIDLPLLEAFKFKAKTADIPYQTMIKRLMREWLGSAR